MLPIFSLCPISSQRNFISKWFEFFTTTFIFNGKVKNNYQLLSIISSAVIKIGNSIKLFHKFIRHLLHVIVAKKMFNEAIINKREEKS